MQNVATMEVVVLAFMISPPGGFHLKNKSTKIRCQNRRVPSLWMLSHWRKYLRDVRASKDSPGNPYEKSIPPLNRHCLLLHRLDNVICNGGDADQSDLNHLDSDEIDRQRVRATACRIHPPAIDRNEKALLPSRRTGCRWNDALRAMSAVWNPIIMMI